MSELTTVTQFGHLIVGVYKKEGQIFMSGEDLGRCLGLVQPRVAVHKIFDRHREELEPHTSVTKTVTEAGIRETRLYNEVGCYLVSMFARSKRAKEVRLWLAALPGKVRKEEARTPRKNMLRLSNGKEIEYQPRSPKYEEHQKRFERLLRKNLSSKRIAKELGVCPKTVCKWIRSLRIS